MSSLLLAQILCEANYAGCVIGYPDKPEPYMQWGRVTQTFTAMRLEAQRAGWETRRGTKYGKDICPVCRAVTIRDPEGTSQ